MKTNNRDDTVTQHLRTLAAQKAAGTRLPSVRELMQKFRVSPVTVHKALTQLAHQGLLEARPGQGTFVATKTPPESTFALRPADLAWQALALGPRRASAEAIGSLLRIPHDRVIGLANGYLPEELQATHLLGGAVARAARRPGVWGRVPAEGLEALRSWFSAEIDGAFQPHEVTICPGTQGALAASFRALLAPGEPLLMESPTYMGAIAAARAAGLRLVPVPLDRDGVRCDMLDDAFRTSGARVFYSQPTYANPTGTVLAAQRRREVLEILARYNAFLIEDDWARDFNLDGDAPPPLAQAERDGHIIYIRSLTKCAAPGLRVGAVCASGPALERLRAARAIDDFFVTGLVQETTLQLVANPAWPRHLRTLRAALRERRDALVVALQAQFGPACLPLVPAGGLHLWMQLPVGISDYDVSERAAQARIMVSPGRHWFPAEQPGSYLRLSFAALPPERYAEGIAQLKEVVDSVAGT
jgi:DNA-binding transcriptional MocR family regulator